MWYYNGILQYVVSHEGLIARDQKKSRHMRNVLWYTSIFVVFGIPYWVINKGNQFKLFGSRLLSGFMQLIAAYRSHTHSDGI